MTLNNVANEAESGFPSLEDILETISVVYPGHEVRPLLFVWNTRLTDLCAEVHRLQEQGRTAPLTHYHAGYTFYDTSAWGYSRDEAPG